MNTYKLKCKARAFFISFIALMILWAALSPSSLSFSSQTLAIGSRGDDVYELQSRLQYLGYYKGEIDGIYGNVTYWAVRNFQYQFGIQIDGIVGSQTKNKLVSVTQNWNSSADNQNKGGTLPTVYTISDEDMKLLARAVYSEARGEPYEGQVAIAAVILNRVKSELFPNTISEVIFQPGAFTAVSDGQFWLEPDETAYQAAKDALNGWDPTYEAIYYFNPDTATSKWIWSRPQIKKIGKHIFAY